MKLEYILNGCTFTELAMCYFPYAERTSALRGLHRYINRCSALNAELQKQGYSGRGKQRLTPRMVKLVVDYLGEPYDLKG